MSRIVGENTAIKDYNLFEFAGIDLKKIKGSKMTRSTLIDRLNNHNYLNLEDTLLYDMLTFRTDFNHDEFLGIINNLRRNVGKDDIDYELPQRNTRSKEEIMNDVCDLHFITSRAKYIPTHQYLVKGKNCKIELYKELYSLIFYEFEKIEYNYSNYYKMIYWNDMKYWIMNSDYRHSIVINRDKENKSA